MDNRAQIREFLVLDAITAAPAIVHDGRLNHLRHHHDAEDDAPSGSREHSADRSD